MLRTPSLLALALPASFLCACPALPAHPPAPPPAVGEAPHASASEDLPDAHQILWQRDLEQALALAKAEDRPLLIAVNMDGESASDRIVREEYRDPAFVSATRPFVCLVASVFRHTPRDFDDQGRRIPCPRLGECTCGEHLALEPLLFERFLSEGERVAPRHALVLQDGTKAWDLSLSFDLQDIDRQLLASAHVERARRGAGRSELPCEVPALDWAALAARRDARGRAALEERLVRVSDEAGLARALAALGAHGDAGAADALRIVVARLAGLSPALREAFLGTAHALGLERTVALELRDRLRALDPLPGGVEPNEPELLPLLAPQGSGEASLRALLLGAHVLEGYQADAPLALREAFGSQTATRLETSLHEQGGAFALRVLLGVARGVTASGEVLPRPGPLRDALREVEELEEALQQLEARLDEAPDDAELLARFGKAALDLGRRRLAAQEHGAQDLLGDAEAHLGRALEIRPAETEWWIERARAAYFLARFADEAEWGRQALAHASGLAHGELPSELPGEGSLSGADWLENEVALEALRWIGDGDARLLAERSGTDPGVESAGMLEGLRALGLVAASPYAQAQDWLSFASFAGALGLWREELAIARAGVERLPAAPELRAYLNNALWNGGHFEQAPFLADALTDAHVGLADAWWFAGQAWLLAAENARRAELPERALAAYRASQARFQHAAALRADYAASANHWVAMGWLGRGLAAARAGRRAEAAECLVQVVASRVPLAGVSDGLGTDVLDLVDKTFEWRAGGPSAVDPLELDARLAALAPSDPFWPVALSDSQLREALRADGRNPERAMRDTVDAAGNPIRMLLGLPNAEGDAYLERAILLARRALPNATSAEDKKALAQADTIWAERMLERGRLDGVHAALAEAAPLLGLAPPAPDADATALGAAAAELRALLGEARPRWRAGR